MGAKKTLIYTDYLENGKRERKATGFYYTADYTVKYIAENAVGPVLRGKFEASVNLP